ncbi:MAG TPA: DUF2934 domain-containing protein [Blastocatellia bacterium]|nr:DUF2934 domain-containing protein [Blastocatellia bacterium]
MSKPAKSKKRQEQPDSDTVSPIIETSETETPAETSRPTYEQIQQRAYEIYLERGGTVGSEIEDWLQAERDLGISDE